MLASALAGLLALRLDATSQPLTLAILAAGYAMAMIAIDRRWRAGRGS